MIYPSGPPRVVCARSRLVPLFANERKRLLLTMLRHAGIHNPRFEWEARP